MIWRAFGLAIAMIGLGTLAFAQTPADICTRGARLIDQPLGALLLLEAQRYQNQIYLRQTAAPDGADAFSGAHLWGQVMAEEAALLPPAAQDLPILILLLGLESESDPITALQYSPQSVLMPDILAVLDRQGLASQAAALRLLVASFPNWDQGLDARVIALSGSDAAAQTLRDGAEAAAQAYIIGDVEKAALALIAQQPGLHDTFLTRIGQTDPDVLMFFLIGKLWADCDVDFRSVQATEDSLSRMGSPQAGLILMDSLLVDTMDGTAEYYFVGARGSVAPQLARVLDIRGLSAHADGVRTGMGLFSKPYPQDYYAREAQYNQFTSDQVNQLVGLAEVFQDNAIWADMIRLAQESGLLPGPVPAP